MQLSPLDIRKQTFKRTLRGVDPEEVRMFLELVASEFERVVQDNAMMAEKLSYQEERLEEYRDLEKSLRNSLVTAERIASESKEASDREAARIIQDANARAERILEDSRERLQRLVNEVETLRSKKETYVRRFRTMLEGQLSILSEHENQVSEIDAIEDDAHDALIRAGARDQASSAGFGSIEGMVAQSAMGRNASAAVGSRVDTVSVDDRDDVHGHEQHEDLDLPSSVGSFSMVDHGTFSAGPDPDLTERIGESFAAEDWNDNGLPFEEQEAFRSAPTEDSAGGDADAFFEVQERREGFFQVDASRESDLDR